MTKEELEKEAEKKYCNCCKWRIEQCLWAWRNTNGLKEPNEKNCSCKEVPAYLAGAESREKRIADLEKENAELTDKNKALEQYADLADAKVDEVKDNLTKAKEIIKELVRVEYADFTNGDYSNELSKVLEKAEQFLKEE